MQIQTDFREREREMLERLGVGVEFDTAPCVGDRPSVFNVGDPVVVVDSFVPIPKETEDELYTLLYHGEVVDVIHGERSSFHDTGFVMTVQVYFEDSNHSNHYIWFDERELAIDEAELLRRDEKAKKEYEDA